MHTDDGLRQRGEIQRNSGENVMELDHGLDKEI